MNAVSNSSPPLSTPMPASGPVEVAGPRRVDYAAALGLLADVEQLHPKASGAFVVGNARDPVGTVLVEDGHICWAVARGMHRRMTDLLRHQSNPPLSVDAIEDVYRRCREDLRPLGETLLASGLVSEDGLRRTLLQHSVEALAMMSSELSRSPALWIERKIRRYDARFTFTSTELTVGLAAMAEPHDSAIAAATIASEVDSGVGAAFVRTREASFPLPVAVLGLTGTSVTSIVEIGRWAVDMLDISSTLDPLRMFVIATTPAGEAAVVWRDGFRVYVAVCEDAPRLAYLVARLRARGVKDGT